MNFDKINGIIQAIEVESKLPSPSHQNLARLAVLAFQELTRLLAPICSFTNSAPDDSNVSTTANGDTVYYAIEEPKIEPDRG